MFNQKTKTWNRFSFSLLSSSAFVAGTLLSNILLVSPANSVQLSNGEVSFDSPPTLVNTSVSSYVRNARSTYYFTISVPANAGESLQAVKIKQLVNVDTVGFNANESYAFLGQTVANSTAVPLASVGGIAPDTGEATVVFDKPLAPGSTVTIALQGQSPNDEGTYLFGVTAFPQGDTGSGLFLGFGTLRFYSGH